MPNRLYDDKIIGEIARYAVNRRANGVIYGRTWAQVYAKFGMSKPTFGIYLNKAVERGYITQEERDKRRKAILKRSFKSLSEKYGTKNARQMCLDAWKEGIGKAELEDIKEWSHNGGKCTHRYAPHVSNNLNFDRNYGKNLCFYDDVEYHSQLERRVAVLLLECGLVKKIRPQKNFQRKFGRYSLDFLIRRKSEDIGIEVHPPIKKHAKLKQTLEEYVQERPKQLREQGFRGRLVIIKAPSDLYDLLHGLHVIKDFADYSRKLASVDEKLRKYDGRPKPKKRNLKRKPVEERRQRELDFKKQQEENERGMSDEELLQGIPE